MNRGNGQLKQSLIKSSFYIWTKFYQQGIDAANNLELNQDYNLSFIRNGELYHHVIKVLPAENELVRLQLLDKKLSEKWVSIY